MNRNCRLCGALALAALTVAVWAPGLQALPEDATAPINIDADSFSGSLEGGWSTLKRNGANPARVSQGSLVIEGVEIRIFSENGEVQSVIATGNPARFQQQPATDKPVIKGSGMEIRLDNRTRLLSLKEDVELNQNDIIYTGTHIDYNLDSRQLDGTDVHMTVPPRASTP